MKKKNTVKMPIKIERMVLIPTRYSLNITQEYIDKNPKIKELIDKKAWKSIAARTRLEFDKTSDAYNYGDLELTCRVLTDADDQIICFKPEIFDYDM